MYILDKRSRKHDYMHGWTTLYLPDEQPDVERDVELLRCTVGRCQYSVGSGWLKAASVSPDMKYSLQQ